jgi:hypothetical protein
VGDRSGNRHAVFPSAPANLLLRKGGINVSDLDCVAFYEKPFLKCRADPDLFVAPWRSVDFRQQFGVGSIYLQFVLKPAQSFQLSPLLSR